MTAPTTKTGRTAIAAGLLVSVMLLLSAASPAFGGPSLLTLRKSVAKALKLAKRADARSRKALASAVHPGPQGARGPAGPAGPAGPVGGAGDAGAPGSTAGAAAPATVIDFRADPGTTRTVYDHGGLMLTARCTSGPTIAVTAKTTVDHAIFHAANVIGTPTVTTEVVEKNDFLITSLPQTLLSTGHLQGTATYSTPAGGVTTLTYGAEQGAFGAPVKGCWFGGTASSGA